MERLTLTPHGGLCTAAHSGPADHLLAWGHGNLVHHMTLGEDGCS